MSVPDLLKFVSIANTVVVSRPSEWQSKPVCELRAEEACGFLVSRRGEFWEWDRGIIRWRAFDTFVYIIHQGKPPDDISDFSVTGMASWFQKYRGCSIAVICIWSLRAMWYLSVGFTCQQWRDSMRRWHDVFDVWWQDEWSPFVMLYDIFWVD